MGGVHLGEVRDAVPQPQGVGRSGPSPRHRRRDIHGRTETADGGRRHDRRPLMACRPPASRHERASERLHHHRRPRFIVRRCTRAADRRTPHAGAH
ncbi:hypothetical protein ACFPRL_27070 [Pseudoclavibacter helvolus]